VTVTGAFFRKEFIVATLLAAGGFFLLGYGAILLTPDGSSTAIIWPADAFALWNDQNKYTVEAAKATVWISPDSARGEGAAVEIIP